MTGAAARASGPGRAGELVCLGSLDIGKLMGLGRYFRSDSRMGTAASWLAAEKTISAGSETS
jgi:hypothetical protein